MSKQSANRTYRKRNRPLPYYYPNCRTPRHWKLSQDHHTIRPTSKQGRSLQLHRLLRSLVPLQLGTAPCVFVIFTMGNNFYDALFAPRTIPPSFFPWLAIFTKGQSLCGALFQDNKTLPTGSQDSKERICSKEKLLLKQILSL